ncbi:MAG: phosphate ABC transporter substrate-binding protein [Pseudomonadota bacterium]
MFEKTPKKQGLRVMTLPAGWSVAMACALAGLWGAPAHAEVTLVVNAVNVAQLDEAYAAKLFLRQVKTFPDGSAAAPVNQKEGASTEEFRSKILKKNAAQFKAYWAQQMFTGGGKPPSELEGDDAVLKYVAETPGGIGYVEAGKTRAGVRVLKK